MTTKQKLKEAGLLQDFYNSCDEESSHTFIKGNYVGGEEKVFCNNCAKFRENLMYWYWVEEVTGNDE